ncbi:hypothetical protein C1A40_05995 [Tamlana carrageenivorans]|uniref:Uncharacterized protein n=1 Tax=Pseudotamlana carrageenivorans TaxID=2069432 RepID=A0A2I7SGM9_9FLAO|nr:hypothetical protein C1A40_05995 [Tamlana carrageenivorans]
MLCSLQGHAKKAAYYNVKNSKKQSLLRLNDISKGSSLLLLNDKNQILLNKHHRNISALDLDHIKDGHYTIKIINSAEVMRIPIIISSGMVFINNKETLINLKQFQSFCHIKNIYDHRSQIRLYDERKKYKNHLLNSF